MHPQFIYICTSSLPSIFIVIIVNAPFNSILLQIFHREQFGGSGSHPSGTVPSCVLLFVGGGGRCPGARRGPRLVAAPDEKRRDRSLSRPSPLRTVRPPRPKRAAAADGCRRSVGNETKRGKFIRRHSHLPSLFHDVLCHTSAPVRTRRLSELLDPLRLIDRNTQANSAE